MPSLAWLEVVIVSVAVAIMLAYHVWLVRRVRHAPLTTTIGLNNHARQVWVMMVMQERRDILAVQTLRNWVMAASFLASTAIVINLGLFNLVFADENTRVFLQALNWFGSSHSTLWTYKALLVMGLLFLAFFNFSLAIRSFNHAGFMLALPSEGEVGISPGEATQVLARGSLHYTFGMRGYYSAIPCMLWFFGPVWMLLGAMALVLMLSRLDRPPLAERK